MNTFRGASLTLIACVLIVACGGGNNKSSSKGSTSPPITSPNNVQPINVNLGPTGDQVNRLYTSVTVCIPGTSTCQTVDNVLLDSTSIGLRILSSALTISLPVQAGTSGNQIGECAVFVAGYIWGPVVNADVQIAGEVASNLPIHIIGVSNFPAAPQACSTGAGSPIDTTETLGANGILGIGTFVQDCGNLCASNSSADLYFSCSDSTSQCSSVTESLSDQVQNPVAHFAADNNGVIIELPTIPETGRASESGKLIFGIGTQSNNGLGTAHVLTLDGNGNFTTVYNGSSTDAFIDSGASLLLFASSISTCSDNPGIYCPSSIEHLSAEMTGQNNVSVTVPFSVANADTLLSSGKAAFNDLAGPTGSILSGNFDWGVPFFYGRSVYFAIDGERTPDGVGPYIAF